MTAVWTMVAVVVGLVVTAVAYLTWRDRERHQALEDSLAAGTARSDAYRHAAERHAVQGVVWDRGRFDGRP